MPACTALQRPASHLVRVVEPQRLERPRDGQAGRAAQQQAGDQQVHEASHQAAGNAAAAAGPCGGVARVRRAGDSTQQHYAHSVVDDALPKHECMQHRHGAAVQHLRWRGGAWSSSRTSWLFSRKGVGGLGSSMRQRVASSCTAACGRTCSVATLSVAAKMAPIARQSWRSSTAVSWGFESAHLH